MKSSLGARRLVSRYVPLLLVVLGAAVLGVFAPGPAAATSPYTIVDLGTLNGWDTSAATAVNDRGEVVGFSYDTRTSGTVEAFEWTRLFGMTSLGSGRAYGLNNLGQVVGQSAGHAVIWDRGNGIVDLGPGSARAVNDAGTVVGQNGEGHAFVWTQAAGMVDLGTFGGVSSWANAVNEAGQVVGAWTDASYVNHAFLWSPGEGNSDFGASTTAAAVNDLGQVAGYAGVNSPPLWTRAILWSGSAAVDLGTLGPSYSYARGMNNAGTVVGMSHAVWPAGLEHAFVWTQDSGILDLGTLGGLSSNASDVNNRGLIVGGAYTAGTWLTSVIHATLWTPADTTPPAAPSTPDLWAGADTGRSSSDDITKSMVLTFSGTAEPGATITLFRDAAAVRTLYADGLSGAWGGTDYTLTADGMFSYTATATDEAGNTSPASAALLVTVDTGAPVLTPVDVGADATSPVGGVVTFSVPVADAFDTAPIVACSPASGTNFPIGDTTVNCTATDTAGNTARASFVVHVRGAAEQTSALFDLVGAIDTKQGIIGSLDAKLAAIQQALAAANAGNRADAAHKLAAFVNDVTAQSGAALTTAQASQLIAAAEQIESVLG